MGLPLSSKGQRGLTGGNAVRLAAFFIPQLNLDELAAGL